MSGPTIRRGDIIRVDLEPVEGSEQAGDARPCVVIQNDTGNKYSPTTIVAPFTKEYDEGNLYPFEVELLSENSVLSEDSVADLSQIRVIDIDKRFVEKEGTVPANRMHEIDRAIRISLGL
ncbi:MAG: type II toxin-antitoxin system PemK/MazF family toxin [Halopenitus sp.]